MSKGVDALVQIFSQDDPGLLIYHPAYLVQMPSTGRERFLIKRVQYDMENNGGELISIPNQDIPNQDGTAPTWRFITDRPAPQPEDSGLLETDTDQGQDPEFDIYTEKFMGHLDEVVKRLRATLDEMRMRVHLGALLQYQYPKNMDLASASRFEGIIREVTRKGIFYYNKDIGFRDRNQRGPWCGAKKEQTRRAPPSAPHSPVSSLGHPSCIHPRDTHTRATLEGATETTTTTIANPSTTDTHPRCAA